MPTIRKTFLEILGSNLGRMGLGPHNRRKIVKVTVIQCYFKERPTGPKSKVFTQWIESLVVRQQVHSFEARVDIWRSFGETDLGMRPAGTYQKNPTPVLTVFLLLWGVRIPRHQSEEEGCDLLKGNPSLDDGPIIENNHLSF